MSGVLRLLEGRVIESIHVQGAPLVDSSEEHPVVLFSHGIGGTRTSYSGICTELGSAVCLLSTL